MMMTTSTVLLIGCLAVGLASPSLSAQSQTCSGGEKARQFDFWIGEWNVTANGKQAGTNSIQPILGGCVLQENWQGAAGNSGSSFNFYNPSKEKWEQFWVWQNGTTLELEGNFQDGKMILEGVSKTRQGEELLNRVTWSKNEDATVRQHWEASSDGGKTWNTLFDGLYKKKDSGSQESARQERIVARKSRIETRFSYFDANSPSIGRKSEKYGPILGFSQ